MKSGIYSLIDPITEEVRYIGLSKNIEYRLKQHRSHSFTTKGTHLKNWLFSLRQQNLDFKYMIAEYCSEDMLSEREIYWINYFKECGCDLVNLDSGGFQPTRAEITKQRISHSLKGHPVRTETKEKLKQAALKQVKHIYTSEQKRKVENKKGCKIIDQFGNIFISISKASLYHNIPIYKIWRKLNGIPTNYTISFKYVEE